MPVRAAIAACSRSLIPATARRLPGGWDSFSQRPAYKTACSSATPVAGQWSAEAAIPDERNLVQQQPRASDRTDPVAPERDNEAADNEAVSDDANSRRHHGEPDLGNLACRPLARSRETARAGAISGSL